MIKWLYFSQLSFQKKTNYQHHLGAFIIIQSINNIKWINKINKIKNQTSKVKINSTTYVLLEFLSIPVEGLFFLKHKLDVSLLIPSLVFSVLIIRLVRTFWKIKKRQGGIWLGVGGGGWLGDGINFSINWVREVFLEKAWLRFT